MRKKIGFIKLIRLWGIVFLTALAVAIVSIDLVTTNHDFNIRMDNRRTAHVEQQKQASKREVERIVNMINYEIMQSKTLGIDVEELKATWMERINHIRFGKNLVGYLFVDDWHGKSLAHGAQADLIGTDMWEYEDSRGNKTTQLLIAASKKKDGDFAYFWWRKPDTGKESPKIVYAKAVLEWELFVGSGVYIEDIEQSITTLQAELNAQTKARTVLFIIIVVLFLVLVLILFNLVNNRLRKDLNLFISFFDKAAIFDKKIDRETIQFVELDQMADSANKMIAERKQSEEALQKSTTFINSIIEQSPFSMWISDSTGTMIRQNQACRDLLNITDEDVVGKYNIFQDNITKEQGFMPLVRSVFEDGEVAKFVLEYDSSQLTHLKLDKSVSVSLEVTISPIKDTNGKIINAIIEHNNITERRLAELELKKYRDHLEELVKERTQELQSSNQELEEKNKELERFNNLFVDREFRIKELKEKIIKLESEL